MNDKNDYGEYYGNNESRLLEEFVDERLDDSELLYECLEWVCEKKKQFATAQEALEAFVFNDPRWSKRFDAYAEKCWESYRDSGPEPEERD